MEIASAAKTIITNTRELTAIPSVALDLITRLNSTETVNEKIIEKIALDPAIVSFILRSCNSALYGTRQEILSIRQAVNYLGFLNLRDLLSAFFIKNLHSFAGKNYINNYLWNHSISVAVMTQEFSTQLKLNIDGAYLAGLLHDIGKLVLHFYHPKKYEAVFNNVKIAGNLFFEAEREAFAATHVDIGYLLMDQWGFSDFLKTTVLHHHDRLPDKKVHPLSTLVAFSNQMVHNVLENKNYDLSVFLSHYGLVDKRLYRILNKILINISHSQSLI